jgi:hypothetical protein
MSAPIFSDIKFRPGVDGAPDNDDDPIVGDMDPATLLVPTDPNTRISNPIYVIGEDRPYYGGGYISNEGTGDITGARVALRSGMQPNAAAGPIQLVSTSASDTMDVQLSGFVSGVETFETLTLTGTTPVTSINDWDESDLSDPDDPTWGAVRVDIGDVPAGNVTVSIMGQTLGIIWATQVIGSQTRLGTVLCSVEWTIALATAKGDDTISSADRLTKPTGVGTYTRATRWPTSDQALTVPGGRLDAGEVIGWVEEFWAIDGMVPALAYNLADVALVGTPVA